MLPVDLFPSTSQPAVRRPTFSVNLGDAALWQEGLAKLRVHRTLMPVANSACLWLAKPATDQIAGGGLLDGLGVPDPFGSDQEPSPLHPVPGDAGSLALGFNDENKTVFSGEVDSLRRDLHGSIRLELIDAGAKLAAFRTQKAFEQQDLGSIVEDLAKLAGINTGSIPSGFKVPFTAFDGTTSVAASIAELCTFGSWLCFVDAEGVLQIIEPPAGSPIQTFTYGEDILRLERRNRPAASLSHRVIGDGATGSNGTKAWSWLVKNPESVTGESSPTPSLSRTQGMLRSTEAVQAAAEGAAAHSARHASEIRWLCAGAPTVGPGEVVVIEGTPDEDSNGEFVVLDVVHQFDKRAGFTSRIRAAKISPGNAGGLDGLLGGLL